MVLDTVDDRTIFFDLLPFFLVAPSGLKIKVKVYTVPGQVNDRKPVNHDSLPNGHFQLLSSGRSIPYS